MEVVPLFAFLSSNWWRIRDAKPCEVVTSLPWLQVVRVPKWLLSFGAKKRFLTLWSSYKDTHSGLVRLPVWCLWVGLDWLLLIHNQLSEQVHNVTRALETICLRWDARVFETRPKTAEISSTIKENMKWLWFGFTIWIMPFIKRLFSLIFK